MSIRCIRNKLEQKKGQRDQILSSISKVESEIENIKCNTLNLERSQTIVQIIAQKTQKELTYSISNLVSLAHASIFSDPYEFDIDFITRRGRTESEIFFKKKGEKFHPMSASGGGAVDLTSLVLRSVCWNLQSPRSRNIIIWDEPLKFLSKDLLLKANEMIHMINEELKIQMIIVTHLEELEGDAVFYVKNINGVSDVKRGKL
jgi:hypothetical protein